MSIVYLAKRERERRKGKFFKESQLICVKGTKELENQWFFNSGK